ncbi:MAG: 1-(5-phosphoribosyl)-5-[(5-phosphoribosylamino)methylideneamino]imidazole-4-carboxamide isomerase [Planctomycetota bacterium]|jgi:phosphoribosylformimino-5-aminoimidazole carboxamide ribotide isomerase
MIAVPAVDLRQGRCVQLVGGRPEVEMVSLPDPVAQAGKWWDMGFSSLHIVDLDAALSLGDNRDVIRKIVRDSEAVLQVGGGVRDSSAVEDILDLGVDRVIIGTRAMDDPAWLARIAENHPGQITVAADVRDGTVLRKGWTESTGMAVLGYLETLAHLPLAGVLCTYVSREGRMEGMDLPGAREIIEASPHPVWMSGGITTMEELSALEASGAAGAVLGMAIYTGTLPATRVAEEFGL